MGQRIRDIYKEIKKELIDMMGVYTPEKEGFIIIEHVFKKNYLDIEDGEITEEKKEAILEIIQERKKGKPLQYIIGNWDFWNLNFKIGQGVLIPRSETEVLVEVGLEKIKDVKDPVVLDLCSGSGCVAISIAKEREDAKVFAIEKTKEAYGYLKQNIEYNQIRNVDPFLGDIFDKMIYNYFDNMMFDLIVSNPPYVKSKDIKRLQREVQYEPVEALDGGDDGLYFYKNILRFWLNKLKIDRFLAFEIGFDQFKPMFEILAKNGLKDLRYKIDLNGIYRVVYGKRII